MLLNTPSYTDISKLVGLLIHMREPYDSHGERVANFAVRMGAALHMGPDAIALLGMAARLHDIGKLLIREEILNAPRKLNASERAEMQNHTRLGWNVVHQLGYDKVICDVVSMHHEKWDGSGYPIGLKGDHIPLPVQIVSICDVFEAMTNMRPYRSAYSPEYTGAYMTSRAGSDFNPQLVQLFFAKVVTNE